LGDIFFENGLWIEAVDQYLKWVELDPDSVAAHNNLGAAYANSQQRELAEKEFKIAFQLDPSLEIAQSNLAIVRNVKSKFEKEEIDTSRSSIVSLVPTDGYCDITYFEEKFRIFISNIMSRVFGSDWWERQVPTEVVTSCQSKKEARKKKQ
jgi:tetratricopeptide (TPR) repeat protein